MVIVFVPALEGLRPQWREAATNLGASTWHYWREVGIPVLTPPFLASTLLLFANAFAAYATAAVLVSQGQPILPLMIRAALTSEVLLGQQNLAFALALEMVVVVAVVMAGLQLVPQARGAVAAVRPSLAFRVFRVVALPLFAAFFALPLRRDARLQHQDPGAPVSGPGRDWARPGPGRGAARVDHHVPDPGGADRGRDDRAARPDDDLGAAAGARGLAADRVPLPAPAGHPRAGHRRRHQERDGVGHLLRR